MNLSAKSFCIIYKDKHPGAKKLAREISVWLKENDAACSCHKSGSLPEEKFFFPAADHSKKNLWSRKREKCGNYSFTHPDWAIILGGDGVMLEAARHYAGAGTGIFGINFGAVGFLTASEPDDWKENFLFAISNSEKIRKCSIIKFVVSGASQSVCGSAINEVVLSHGKMARLLNLRVTLNNQSLGRLRSDGLIFYTPLGSSAYNSSAGGPALYPELEVLGMTPICPFMTRAQSIVFPSNSVYRVEQEGRGADCFLTIDGQVSLAFHKADRLEITSAPRAVNLWLPEKKYLDRLAYGAGK